MRANIRKDCGRINMCTAATYLTKDFYMGRTLDYDSLMEKRLQ